MSEHSQRPFDWVGAWSEKRAALSPDSVGLVDATTGEPAWHFQTVRHDDTTVRVDVGQNISGWVAVEVRGAVGDEVVVRGEETDGVIAAVSVSEGAALGGGRGGQFPGGGGGPGGFDGSIPEDFEPPAGFVMPQDRSLEEQNTGTGRIDW